MYMYTLSLELTMLPRSCSFQCVYSLLLLREQVCIFVWWITYIQDKHLKCICYIGLIYALHWINGRGWAVNMQKCTQYIFCYLVVNFTSGNIGGLTATAVAHPFDVVRTRVIGQGKPKVYGALIIYFAQTLNYLQLVHACIIDENVVYV